MADIVDIAILFCFMSLDSLCLSCSDDVTEAMSWCFYVSILDTVNIANLSFSSGWLWIKARDLKFMPAFTVL